MDPATAWTIALIVAGIAGLVLGLAREQRILDGALRLVRDSGWRAAGLLAGFVLLTPVFAALLLGPVTQLREAAPTPTRVALLVLMVGVVALLTPWLPRTMYSPGPVSPHDDIVEAGGSAATARILGCGGSIIVLMVGSSWIVALVVVILGLE